MHYIILFLIGQVVFNFCDKSSSNDVTNMSIAVKQSYVKGFLGAVCFKEKITIKSAVSVIIAAFSVVMINYFN